jgi:hypothetical protein
VGPRLAWLAALSRWRPDDLTLEERWRIVGAASSRGSASGPESTAAPRRLDVDDDRTGGRGLFSLVPGRRGGFDGLFTGRRVGSA